MENKGGSRLERRKRAKRTAGSEIAEGSDEKRLRRGSGELDGSTGRATVLGHPQSSVRGDAAGERLRRARVLMEKKPEATRSSSEAERREEIGRKGVRPNLLIWGSRRRIGRIGCKSRTHYPPKCGSGGLETRQTTYPIKRSSWTTSAKGGPRSPQRAARKAHASFLHYCSLALIG